MKTIITLALLFVITVSARAQQVDLLTMGDWGSGDRFQRAAADNMSRYIESAARKFDAMFLAGDNFYVTLDGGIRDPRWKTMFEELYDPKIFNFPFYVALGNHDYQLDRHMVEFAYAQANPQSRWKLPSRWYRVDIPSENPLVTVLVLDSNIAVMGDYAWGHQLKWLQAELAKPRTAKWLISVCHHPLYSNGDHGDDARLQKAWGEIVGPANLDFYIAGHDHDLQHLQIKPHRTSFLLVGGGGAGIRPIRNDKRGPFSVSSYGFGHLTFTDAQATVRLVGAEAKILHAFTRASNGTIDITLQGQSDRATPRRVIDITRPGAATAPTTVPVR